MHDYVIELFSNGKSSILDIVWYLVVLCTISLYVSVYADRLVLRRRIRVADMTSVKRL